MASVGVAPEARGRGVGSALVEHLHGLARDRGDAVTVLYAFRQAFYLPLGYAPTSATQRLRLDPRAVPDWSVAGFRVRPARAEDRARWQVLAKDVAAVKSKTEARKQAARADFNKWLSTVKADDIAGKVPTAGLVLHAPLTMMLCACGQWSRPGCVTPVCVPFEYSTFGVRPNSPVTTRSTLLFSPRL